MGRFTLTIMVLAGLALAAGCASNPRAGTPAPSSTEARRLADEVASSTVDADNARLYALLEPAVRSSIPTAEADPLITTIINYGGKPQRAEFKQVESGQQSSAAGVRPMLTYWYLLETVGGVDGPYYLKVDIVADGAQAAVTQFAVVNFPGTGPPDSLK